MTTMSSHEFDIDLSQFDEFAEADLLDLVEGTMDPERAMELAQAVKVRDPELLRRLIRMQADRMELTAHGEPVAPPHLLQYYCVDRAEHLPSCVPTPAAVERSR